MHILVGQYTNRGRRWLKNKGNRLCAIETTVFIIKPDGVRRGLVPKIYDMIPNGYTIVSREVPVPGRELAEQHYAMHAGRPFFEEIVDNIAKGRVVVCKITGPNAVQVIRDLVGHTDPSQAAPGTIRALGTSKQDNLVHASDSAESAAREIALWFPEG